MPYKDKNKANESARRSQKKRRAKIHKIKEENPCTDCGVYYPYYVMHFDHRPDEDKSFEVSLISCRKWETVATEIAKCDLVCANCHAIRTHDRVIFVD